MDSPSLCKRGMLMNLLRASFVLALGAATVAAHAVIWTFNVALSGSQEVPPNGATATGVAFGSYDDATNILTLTVQATGFTGVPSAAHVHRAPAGVNGPVIQGLTNTASGNAWSSNGNYAMSQANEFALISGGTYVNIHTTQFPGGEIRGQLNMVPEPATLLALLGGLGAVALRRRRR